MISCVLQNIASCRKARRITQRQMARLLQMDQSAYCRIEKGNTDLTLVHLERIAQVLQVHPHLLIPAAPSMTGAINAVSG